MSLVDYTDMGAIFSADETYRYRLWRQWRGDDLVADPKTCAFILLNPSTADHLNDDPTIRRCVAFAKAWGYRRLEIVNLFALAGFAVGVAEWRPERDGGNGRFRLASAGELEALT